ncbi:hypothetical protein FPOA_03795 [Fusarium poae]|jgi:hypothetical protein|uniref:Aflatoxin regulatory protein domain-containing protein n=2 Tax=Fusarium poae TaxID=36050 RepID=A0A1B8ARR5_FUSPO|nr:hypothetical protein FPOA_03795 [Fusarium poae]
MLCVAKNQKCEYLVVSRPRRRRPSGAGGGSKSRNDNEDEDGDSNTVASKQSNQARMHKRWSRMQTIRQSSPLSTQPSSPKEQLRATTVSKPSLQDSNNNTTGPDMSLEDAQQLIFNDALFPDPLGSIPAVFPQFEPAAARDFFNSMPIPAEKIHAGRGITAEALTARGDSSKQNNHTSVYSSSSADSIFEFGVDQMDFLMDESRITAAMAPHSARDRNKVTTEARPTTTHSSTPSDSEPVFNPTSIPATSSCGCMMTAVTIYEALQVQLVWGDPIAGPSTTSSPKSSSAGSSYSSGPSWSDSASGSAYSSPTSLITQQTILKRQKTVLLRCDSLTRCGTCWSRPDFVMLIITICDRILTSLEAVERFVCTKNDDDMNTVSCNGNAAAVDIQATLTSSSRSDQSLSASSNGLQSGVGAWQIDDEDEQELVISLIKSRVARLGNLINIAEGTISANGWPWHERLVQALRKRSNKLAISLSFRGFP